MKKKCIICLVEKDETEFAKSGNGTRRSRCNVCRVIERKKQYDPKKNQKRNKRLRNICRTFIKEYLENHPCVDCGDSRWQVLEFDHVRGEKVEDICAMVRKQRSLRLIKEEIEKCDVRCANCHRLKTHKDVNSWRANDEDLVIDPPGKSAKLKAEDIPTIRWLFDSGAKTAIELASIYMVDRDTIYCVVNRKTWKD